MRRLLAVALATVSLIACGDDDAAQPPAEPAPPSSTTTVVETGGIDVPHLSGTFPIAVPAVGFGIAVPEGWEATLLADEALDRLEEADLVRPFFLDAARSVAATGAVFYAAGVDSDGRVSELKIDVQDDADTSPAAIRELAGSVVASDAVDNGSIVDDLEGGRLRVDYRVELPSAEDGELIEAHGSQLFVPDGDRLWSIIVTSEDEDTQTLLLDLFERSFTLD